MTAVKGHGTQNDFVLLPDFDGALTLSPELVRALCDRRAGIGADGVLRIVRSEREPAAAAMAADAPYFMDYRNADGSLAEMCGNGVRVFARYLHACGLVGTTTAVATRGGIKQVRIDADGTVTVGMGTPLLLPDRPAVTAPGLPDGGSGRAVELPNPHVVVPVDSAARLALLDLNAPPTVTPALAHGQNVEFVVRESTRHLRMRVHERGVGETRSCGTGICAAVVASASGDGEAGPDATRWVVDVPGGRCEVTWQLDGTVELRGPAVLVGRVELDDTWLATARNAL